MELRSTSNQAALTGEISMDGVTTSESRVLLTGQTDASENGIYVTATGAWARADDADAAADFEFAKPVPVTAGTAGAGTTWYYKGADSPVVGTTTFSLVYTIQHQLLLHLVISSTWAPTGSPSPVPTGVIAAIDTTRTVSTPSW